MDEDKTYNIFAEFKCDICGLEWNMEDPDGREEDLKANFAMGYCSYCYPNGEVEIKSLNYSIEEQ